MSVQLNSEARDRLLYNLDVYIAACEADRRGFMQANRQCACEVREQIEQLNLMQAHQVEQAVLAIENRPRNPSPLLDFGPVVVNPCDYLQFIE